MAHPSQYLSNATFIATYVLDRQIRYRVAEIENAFQSVFSAQATSTNVADNAPASIPRFTIQSGPKRISVSQVTAQFDLDFSEQKKSISNTLEIVKKNFENFWTGVTQLKALAEIKHIGMVITINTPTNGDRATICEAILSRYAKLPAFGKFADASIRFGFLDETERFYNNVSLNYYEVRAGFVKAEIRPNKAPLEIEIEKLPVQEVGYETKLDINSRPMVAASIPVTKDLGSILLSNITSFVDGKGKEFLTW